MENLFKDALEKLRSFIFARERAYKTAFSGTEGEKVLVDLARFCRANETAFHEDPRVHAVIEGRREVWLRIQHHLKLDSEALWKLYGRKDLE